MKFFLTSLAIHATLLGMLSLPSCKVKEEAKGDIGYNQDFMKIIPKTKGHGVPCSNWYGGIGITTNPVDDTVERSVPGYPAYEAGNRTGDKILSPKIWDIRGKPDSIIILKVSRDSVLAVYALVRDKVCEGV